ncbi:Type IV pilus biogenesis and competence protein PilQ [bacterium HR33]|nr:Type IV pilus biogenesis and competence protein PilQ [bacterium HR33]
MMRFLLLAAALLPLAAPRALAGPGEVTAVRVLSGPGRVEVVIEVRGGVSVQDFVLRNPDRLVIDVQGATLAAPRVAYDGQNRGGVINLRYAQFRPDVVRIVLELERLQSYEIQQAEDVIRVSFGTDRTFAAWSSSDLGWLREAAEREAAVRRAALERAEQQLPQSQQPAITVSYDNANISDVIAGFAAFSGKSIIVGKDVEATVTATITNQPWDIALQQILQAQGLSAREDYPGIIRVDAPQTLAQLDSIEPLVTQVFRINYATAADLVQPLGAIQSPRGKIVADPGTNSLIVTDTRERVQRYEEMIRQLDVRTPQVSIQTRLVFVDRSDLENLGVKYDLGSPTQFFNRLVQRRDPSTAQPVDTDGDGVPDAIQPTEFFDPEQTIIDLGGNSLSALANAEATIPQAALRLIFSTAIGNFNLTSFVEALEEVQLADLQAEPLISTADNTQAQILVGERTPIRVIDVSAVGGTGANVPRATVDYQETGIKLTVTPHVTNDRRVLMDIRAENSSVQPAPGDLGFTFQTQEAIAKLLVNDGETAVIGGLTVTEIRVSKTGIPFLVDLPLIGRIFGFTSRRETRRDLLILVTPHIVDEPSGSEAGRR